jgi:hypothetical protein
VSLKEDKKSNEMAGGRENLFGKLSTINTRDTGATGGN